MFSIDERFAGSSNGRTAAFGAVRRGSSPLPAAKNGVMKFEKL